MLYSAYLDRLGRRAEAVEQAEHLHSASPEDSTLKNNLAYILIESGVQIERAQVLLTEALRSDPESPAALDSMGWLYYRKGQFAQAIQYIYQAAAKSVAPDAVILDHLGDVAYRLGRADEARSHWRGSLRRLRSQLVGRKYLADDVDRIENKLHRLDQDLAPQVAPLFDQTD